MEACHGQLMGAVTRHMAVALCVLVAGAAPAVAQSDADIERKAADRDDNELRGRLAVSHSLAVDDQTAQRVSFTDLRLVADAMRLGGLPLGLHLDGRGRNSWTDVTSDRLTVREAYIGYGEPGDAWRVNLGRQLVRSVASAEIDGLRIERRLGDSTSASIFGGLLPHPITGALSSELAGVGAGYVRRTRSSNHAGGGVFSWFGGEVDRVYVSQRSYFRIDRTLSLSGFGIADFMSPRPLVGSDGSEGASVDLTSVNGMVRYVPTRWLDSSVSVNHNHTVLPGKWWQDWLAEKRREIGFVLDGDDPVGTRLTSVRWTNNLRVSRDLVPYTRLRYDWRHTEEEQGYEGRAGLKWRPRTAFVDVSYAYRDYFSTTSQLGSLLAGGGTERWGGEAGMLVLHSKPQIGGDPRTRTSLDAHAMAWIAVSDLFGSGQRVHLAAQYRGLFDPDVYMHTLFVLIDYRL
jgi:hypothetical protein